MLSLSGSSGSSVAAPSRRMHIRFYQRVNCRNFGLCTFITVPLMVRVRRSVSDKRLWLHWSAVTGVVCKQHWTMMGTIRVGVYHRCIATMSWHVCPDTIIRLTSKCYTRMVIFSTTTSIAYPIIIGSSESVVIANPTSPRINWRRAATFSECPWIECDALPGSNCMLAICGIATSSDIPTSSDVCQNATRYKCHKQLDQLMAFRCEMRKAQDPIRSGHARWNLSGYGVTTAACFRLSHI